MSKETLKRFTRIHRHYDLLNHVFSLNADKSWRKEAAIASIMNKKRYRVLDVAGGTGDLTISIYTEAHKRRLEPEIVCMDFNDDMLSHAAEKTVGMENVTVEHGDALHMKYPNSSFDVLASSFALRNFDSLDRFSSEAYRVLRKGGKIVLVDMALPDSNAWFMRLYFKLIDRAGSLVSPGAYKWLTRSIINFDKNAALKTLRKNGFKGLKLKSLRMGVAFMITGRK